MQINLRPETGEIQVHLKPESRLEAAEWQNEKKEMQVHLWREAQKTEQPPYQSSSTPEWVYKFSRVETGDHSERLPEKMQKERFGGKATEEDEDGKKD